MSYAKEKAINMVTKFFGAISVVTLLMASFFLVPKQTLAAPFECDSSFYQVIFGGLNRLDPMTGQYILIGSTGAIGTNAIGYNPSDNYIYGWRGASGGGVVRIEDDATTTALGVPVGLPTAGVSYSGGDIDNANNLYLVQNGTGNLYAVDLSTNTATQVPLIGPNPPTQELVYVNGYLYNISASSLFEVNLATGVVTQKPLSITLDPDAPGSVYGAGWAADNSKLFFSRNSDGQIFEIEDFTGSNPVAMPVLQGQPTASNDGASCASARSPLPPFYVNDDTNQTKSNTGVGGNLLQNDSGRDISVTDYSQPLNGMVVVNPDGSYTYTPNPGFAGVDVFTYTVTDEYGDELIATVTITVTTKEAQSSHDSDQSLAETGVSQYVAASMVLLILSGTIALIKISRTSV